MTTKIPVELSSTPGIVDGSNATAITIDSSENVGIGTTSPSQKLETTGNIFINAASGNPDLTIKTAGTGNNPFVAYRAGDNTVFDNMGVFSTATDYWRVAYGSSGSVTTELLAVTSEGKVGIGTTSPSSLLHVDGSFSGTAVTIHNTAGAASTDRGLDVETSTTGTTVQRWLNAGTELMRVGGNGSVSIGTTVSIDAAHLTVQSNGGNGLSIGKQDSSNAYRHIYHTASTGILSFASSSNTATLTNAGSWSNASDIAYKKDIVDTQYGLETIKALQPRDYKLKETNEADTGFIAQELETHLPQFVEGEDGSKTLNYGQLTAVLTKAIQEQQEQIEQLKTEIQTLKGE